MPDPRTIPPADRVLRARLAEKLLHDWAQNRQQVRVPLTLNLGRMESGPRGLLLQVVAAAVAARGAAAGDPRLAVALQRAGAEPAEVPAEPPDLFRLIAALEEAGLGAHGYAAAALVLDRRVPGERAFLDWLGARLRLPDTLTAGLVRRYRR